ncbi:MAG: glycosyltransferase [Gemmatimonadota bacterium]|nr:glycosyltransferase [Gemmatimonadota bacterium]
MAALSTGDRTFASAASLGVAQGAVRIAVVVPVLNAMRFLPRTIPSLLEAARFTGGVQLIYVDNGSTDGSYEYLTSIATKGIGVLRLERGVTEVARNLSAAARNFGARQSDSQFLSFLDADCMVANNYFTEALGVLVATGASATGCETQPPPDRHWIEATWHALHYVGRDREVHYLTSANFFISRKAFEDVGGFRDDLPSGADAEIGLRLTIAGYRIYESPAVGAIDLGLPKSVRVFYRRNVWHATGMLGTVTWHKIDKPTAMMTLHLLATLGGLVVLLAGPFSLPIRFVIAVLLQFAVPAITVAYRSSQTGRAKHLVEGTALYWLYYSARLQALALLAVGRGHRYMK